MNIICCRQRLAGQNATNFLNVILLSNVVMAEHLTEYLKIYESRVMSHEQAPSCQLCFTCTDLELLVWQGLLIPFFFKLRWSFFGGWFLSALNCFAGGVFLTFGGYLLHSVCSNLLPLKLGCSKYALEDSLQAQVCTAVCLPVLGLVLLRTTIDRCLCTHVRY